LTRGPGSPRAGGRVHQRENHGGAEVGGRSCRQRAGGAGAGQWHHAREGRGVQGCAPRELAHRQAGAGAPERAGFRSGDLRRVRDLVSETFTDRKQPLPVVTLVQLGGLPLERAQTVLGAVASAKKDVSPEGVIYPPTPMAVSEGVLNQMVASAFDPRSATATRIGTELLCPLRKIHLPGSCPSGRRL
jgi:hypothetical protein